MAKNPNVFIEIKDGLKVDVVLGVLQDALKEIDTQCEVLEGNVVQWNISKNAPSRASLINAGRTIPGELSISDSHPDSISEKKPAGAGSAASGQSPRMSRPDNREHPLNRRESAYEQLPRIREATRALDMAAWVTWDSISIPESA